MTHDDAAAQEQVVTTRILSISGLRGIIGDGLTPEYAARFAAALGTIFNGGKVVVARDGRSTGEMLYHSVVSGLLATGCEVLDAGIATTPTCGVLVRHHGAAGGLQITASHNPIEWNGLKPFSPDGSVFNRDLGQQLLSILDTDEIAWKGWAEVGRVTRIEDPPGPHIEKVLSLIDVDAIRKRKFRVVLDCNHGSGATCGPRLLQLLGCDVTVLGGTPDGRFEHIPEPVEKNLGDLCAKVREIGADVGFAQDPDADRLAIVDNTGRYIGEELTLALGADFVLARRKGPFVVNGSTSRVTADIAAKHGCQFHRSFVGEAHVCAKMRAVHAVLGGEGNGGVIDPQVGYVRDSLVSMAYVLAGLTEKKTTVAEWADSLPYYTIVKDKLECPSTAVDVACDALRNAFRDAEARDGDGLRLDWKDRWVQVRASNTEPIIRVIAEAPETDDAVALIDRAMSVVEAAVQPFLKDS
ncbi:MAG: phosphoglucosamine mutase [Planctomycetaceae bacterium]|nr:phosphoglucosamine mutase [Planctomycetaceae bacterium]